jgi:hypothetical protein
MNFSLKHLLKKYELREKFLLKMFGKYRNNAKIKIKKFFLFMLPYEEDAMINICCEQRSPRYLAPGRGLTENLKSSRVGGGG